MIFNNIFRYLKQISVLLLLCFLQVQYVVGQTVSKNEEGDKIVIYGDGSWRYLDETDQADVELYRSSDLYKDSKKAAEVEKTKQKVAKVKGSKKTKTKSSKPKKEKIANQKRPKKKKTKSKKNTDLAKANKSKKKPQNKKAGKPSKKDLQSVPDNTDYSRKVKREIISIRDKQNIALEKERIANFAADKYEREYKSAKKRQLDKSKLGKIEAKYKEAKLQLKMARTQNKILLKQRRSYESLQKKGPDGMAKSYAKLSSKYDGDFKIDPPKKQEALTIRENKSLKNKISRTRKEDNTQMDFEEEADATPSAYAVSYPAQKLNANKAAVADCAIAFQGKDSFSGKKRLDLEPSLFFSFTSQKMRRYFEEGDMIACNAYLSSVSGGYKFVCIEVTVASETAQKSYGSLEKQAMLSVRLVDGTNVNLYNNKTDYGFLDPLKKTVIYKGQYLIPSEHVRTLSKVDIDKVRLVWSTGYEDYNIYETDFIINQLKCLDQ